VFKRHRFKQTLTLAERLANESKRLRVEAERLRPGPERDSVLRKARHIDAASHMDGWLSSPELRHPT
jgi:hypothetical protein